jgi:outer membrane protein assembly factor BamB
VAPFSAGGQTHTSRRTPRQLPALTVAVLAVGALVLSSCDWTQFRLGPEHSAYSTTESAIGVGNVGTLVERWTATTGGLVHSSPAVANGVVYVGSEDGKLYAFDAAGGALLWTAPTGGPIWSSPAAVNGVVYVGSDDGKLYAFDATGANCSGTPKTCTPLWTAQTGGPVRSSPTVANGVIYVGSEDTNLYAFDAAGAGCSGTPKTCTPLWIGATGGNGPSDSSPAVANGVVYIGSELSRGYAGLSNPLVAFDATGANCSGTPKTCTPLWTGQTGGTAAPSKSSPSVVNGVVYIGSSEPGYNENSVNGYDAAGTVGCSGAPKTCAPLWTRDINGSISDGQDSSPAVANGRVYIGSTDVLGDLFGFAAYGATVCCTLQRGFTYAPTWSSPAVANGVVYVGSSNGKLDAFDALGNINCTNEACSALWTGTTGGEVDSSPAVANGMVYVGSNDGKLYAFGLP